jgi:hypothetical protein
MQLFGCNVVHMYSAQLPFMEDNRYQRFYSLMASCDTHSTVYSVATSVRSRRITSANNTCPRQLFIFPMGLPTRASRLCSPHLSEMTVHAAFFFSFKKKLHYSVPSQRNANLQILSPSSPTRFSEQIEKLFRRISFERSSANVASLT